MLRFARALMTAVLLLATARSAFAAPIPCERIKSLTLPHATITLAELVTPGAFTPPPLIAGVNPPPAEMFKDLPAFCRVTATLQPSSDSDIKIEVWLPASGWNGKFLGVGNGGWAGTITYALPGRSLADGIRRGYATAATDTGHTGVNGDASFALGHPEKLIDFAWRAVREMTVAAKAIIRAHYDIAPRLSYWNGCSTGGKQGLKEAQRHPEDYDGIVAGAPANNWTHLQASLMAMYQATHKDPASFVPPSKYPAMHDAVMNACDTLDGVKDGVLENPSQCRFDPATLLCKSEDSAACLTAPQVEAVRKIYEPIRNPRTGAEIYPALARGSEPGWSAAAGTAAPFRISADHFRYIVFKNPEWDALTLDLDKDVALADRVDNGLINATDPDLAKYFRRGGKLLMYHGWNDQLISPVNSINYFNSVVKAAGTTERAAQSIRLFMVPGMNHCSGGDGTDAFDAVKALEDWVERKQAPDLIRAARLSNGVASRTRPLCPFPQVAEYKGTGSTDDAANFVCRAK